MTKGCTLKYVYDIYLLLSAVFGCKESHERGVSLLFSSNALFWLTRDNPYHNTAILGGMWGARMDTGMRSAIDLSFRKLINDVKLQTCRLIGHSNFFTQTAQSKHGHKGLDQTMLAKWVWPEVIGYSYSSTICRVSKVKEHSMVHDSYLCKRSFFGGAEPKPFPTRRETGKVPLDCLVDHLSFFPGAYNFVGAAGPMELKATCPEECRPPDHKDWTLC